MFFTLRSSPVQLRFVLLVALTIGSAFAVFAADDPVTERRYLSGRGPKDAVPWEFVISGGRRAGEQTTIPVPSHWELHGFGTYNYGQMQNKSDERGRYRLRFRIPAEWRGKRVRLGFDGVMTDATVSLNGRPAGPTHQGGFTQFRYDVTPLLKLDEDNLLEVDVAKVSANPETERAERGGDYWVMGGIYRPVWLEAVPAQSIDHVAIDARADGTLTADVTLGALRDRQRPDGPTLAPESLEAQILDANGQPVGAAFRAKIPAGGTGRLRLATRAENPRLWTSETPHLYSLRISRQRAGATIHTTTTRFGFRTFEVRDGEGLFLNGQRILLKGVNRHSFRPKTGRALDREDCYEDVRLLRAMNMNSVRMSHYPPDEAFLEACDELGLYVLDELSGSQAAHDTAVGRLLVRELVERDVNHPSILFWDNGNEGGWNRDLDGDFALYDPQRRPVLHPWDPFGGIDTRHYTDFSEHARRLRGPNLVMPTEVLHALYDGGAGAGLKDYWSAIERSPFGAGAFIWAFSDEGLVRTDENNRIDVFSTFAPDGILGPNFEKEGSYYTVREIWSPVQIEKPALKADFDGALTVHNRYDFVSLAQCRLRWRWLSFNGGEKLLAEGTMALPDIAPHETGRAALPLPAPWREADALAVTAIDPAGEELWTWTWGTAGLDERTAAQLLRSGTGSPKLEETPTALRLSAGNIVATFDPASGTLVSLRRGQREFALRNGPRLAFARPVAAGGVEWLPWRDETTGLTRHLAKPQLASSVEVELELPRGTPYLAFKLELSADGSTWKTIYDASRRPGDGGRFDFPPQRVAAVRLSNLRCSDGETAPLKTFRIGYAGGRFPNGESAGGTVTSGTTADPRAKNATAWVESRGANGLDRFRWTLASDGSLRLDYSYGLDGEFAYHGITFDHDEDTMKSLRWLGEGPYRVWQNRLHGTWLGIHATERHVLQPGESFRYPEFEGYFAGMRWADLTTTAGRLKLTSGSPELYLRVGTSRISHPRTTAEFPAGDLSFLHAIPGMGSKFKSPEMSGPSGQAAKASGRYEGSIVFAAEE